MKTVLLAGCGKMGSAMLAGWLDNLDDTIQFLVIDPMIGDNHFAQNNSRVTIMKALPESNLPSLDIIVLAMKPQMLMDALPDLMKHANDNTVWLSIAAGITTSKLKSSLGIDARIIRTMPNTPAAIGRGITAMLINEAVPQFMRDMAHNMMAVVGEVVIVEEEMDMDRVTAVSGSGPAYIFLMREVMEKAAINSGLSPELAEKLVAATMSGSVALMDEGKVSPEQLRINVTSPNGTTQAALDVLMKDKGLADLIEEAVLAARDRSIELGS